jgi:hypothetical protein
LIPLDLATYNRYLTELRARETSDGLFPPGWTWPEEQERARRAVAALEDEFHVGCRQRWFLPNPDEPYDAHSTSTVIVVPPTADDQDGIVVALCTFGLATGWVRRPIPDPNFRSPLWRLFHRGRRAMVDSVWTPGWWDDASDDTERSLARAATALKAVGYTYVPDVVLDAPHDGRDCDHWLNSWFGRYFGPIRTAFRAADTSETASAHRPSSA